MMANDCDYVSLKKNAQLKCRVFFAGLEQISSYQSKNNIYMIFKTVSKKNYLKFAETCGMSDTSND
jgi:hypothetical protein